MAAMSSGVIWRCPVAARISASFSAGKALGPLPPGRVLRGPRAGPHAHQAELSVASMPTGPKTRSRAELGDYRKP